MQAEAWASVVQLQLEAEQRQVAQRPVVERQPMTERRLEAERETSASCSRVSLAEIRVVTAGETPRATSRVEAAVVAGRARVGTSPLRPWPWRC